ncbi:hypothetical protein ACOAKC_02945 [Hathewaya histolytica]|uniref:hypothetical protein n=1 Tax=Hathewaya histolytica TaxID=1498 RepID=UPI003B67843E
MSLFNNLKRELRNKKIYFILISVFILIYSLAVYSAMYSLKDKAVINIVSTLNGEDGIVGPLPFIYLYTPMLFFGVNSHMVNSEKGNFIIKMKNRKSIFNSHVIFVIALSIILSILVICLGYSIGGIYAGGFKNLWPKDDIRYTLPQYKNLDIRGILNSIPLYVVILKTFIIKFMGFAVVGLLLVILKNIINNSGALGITILLIPFIDDNFFNGALLMNKFSLDIESWINTSDFLINIMYLVFLLMALYLIGGEIYKNKDFISKGY